MESILYTLIYVLAVFKGPRNLRVQQDYDLSRSSPSVFEWFDYKRIQQSLRYVARSKMGHFHDFDNAILNKMDPYFHSLKPFLRSLLVAAFPTRDYRYWMIKLSDDQYHVLKRLEANQEKFWADQNRRKAKKMRLN